MTTDLEVAAEQRPLPLRALMLLALAAFASSINLRVCDPLLPVIARDFSTSVGAASAIVAGFAVGYGLLQLVFGPVGDRFGKYFITALCSIATGVATAWAASATTLDGLIVARFVAGAAAAGPIPLAFAWIGDAAFGGNSGELRVVEIGAGRYRAEGDVNGDRVADLAIEIVSATDPSMAWFIM